MKKANPSSVRIGPSIFLFWALALVILASGLAGPARGQEGAPYRRFIEAEDLRVEGAGYRPTSHNASSSNGTMTCSLDEANAAKSRLVLDLERTLPAGRYCVWAAGMILTRGQTDPVLEFGLGGTFDRKTIPIKEPGGYSLGWVIEAREPFKTLQVAVRSPEPRFWLDRIYLSGNPNDLRYDRARKTTSIEIDLIQREMDGLISDPERVVEPPNWLANGGFEVGFGNYDWATAYQAGYTLAPEGWVADRPYEGERCLRLKLNRRGDLYSFQLKHRVLKLKPNQTYHFQGMFRSDRPVNLTVRAETAYDKPVSIGSVKIAVGPEWQKISAVFKTTDDRRGYFLNINAEAAEEAALWLDGLLLASRPAEKFTPAAPVEAGVYWPAPGKVFHLEKPVEFTLLARSYQAGSPALVNLRYRVVDYFDRTVIDRLLADWPVAADTTASRKVDLNTGRTGAFRLLVEGNARSGANTWPIPLQEYVFCVVPEPPVRMQKTFGAYLALVPQAMEAMNRIGIHRTVTLSCGNSLLESWEAIQPEPGKFIWWDDRVKLAEKYDIGIIADLEPDIPKWALDPADEADRLYMGKTAFSRRAWEEFIRGMVGHYRGYIKDWLIVDEPYHRFTPQTYAELIKATHRAAKAADPDCRVLVHGGYYENWLADMEKAGAVPYFDGISDYARSRAQGEIRKEFARKHNKFVINGEYGVHKSLYRTIEAPDNPADRRSPLIYTANTESVVAEAVRAVCWSGGIKYSRYDARYPGGDFTKLDRHKCMFEYDGSLKPAGVAYAMLAQLLDGFRGVEELNLNPDLETFLLEDGKRFALAVMARDGRVLAAVLDLPDGVTMRDIQGNPVDPRSGPVLSGALHYLIGPKDKLAAVSRALAACRPEPLLSIKAEPYLDEAGGRYRLKVTCANLSRSRTLNGLVLINDEVMRDFWAGPRVLKPIPPGKSGEEHFDLNYYRGDRPFRKTVTMTTLFDGVTATDTMLLDLAGK
ncbi:MAG: hypothetical protein BWY73_00472 [candidate division TA06 bacterium ADurb.Bin417]|uniref:Carbohydrate binding domain protein n=1 Tax=candidate division TA06 bacterium ADurb.Bin417 TaxID=1852828 RepID=A0A1V5MJN3_UNCT6|nr:MAG: hypothetical protein BWY73_00472 [candidate division TA06 bacterium ADurb.Bin417]